MLGGCFAGVGSLPYIPQKYSVRWRTDWQCSVRILNTALTARRTEMSLGTILLIVLVLLLVGAIPAWPHSRSWGYGPSGGLGLIVVILLVLFVMGRI